MGRRRGPPAALPFHIKLSSLEPSSGPASAHSMSSLLWSDDRLKSLANPANQINGGRFDGTLQGFRVKYDVTCDGIGFRAAAVLRALRPVATDGDASSSGDAQHSLSSTLGAVEGSVCFVDLPEDTILAIMVLAGSPLLPASSVGLACCCKGLRRLPLLKQARLELKREHKAAETLAVKVGTSLTRMGAEGCGRLGWSGKSLLYGLSSRTRDRIVLTSPLCAALTPPCPATHPGPGPKTSRFYRP